MHRLRGVGMGVGVIFGEGVSRYLKFKYLHTKINVNMAQIPHRQSLIPSSHSPPPSGKKILGQCMMSVDLNFSLKNQTGINCLLSTSLKKHMYVTSSR